LLINIEEKFEDLQVVKMAMLFWIMTSYGFGDRNKSYGETHLGNKDGSVSNETTVVGNCEAQFRKQQLHKNSFMLLNAYDTSNLREWHFRLNHTFHFHETCVHRRHTLREARSILGVRFLAKALRKP